MAILLNTVYCYFFAPHIKMFIIGGMMYALVGTLLGFIIGIGLGRIAVAHGIIECDYLVFGKQPSPKRVEDVGTERVVTLMVLLLVFGLPCFILLGLSSAGGTPKDE